MKKLFFLASLLLAFTAAIAQPVILASTNNPHHGDRFKLFGCNTTGVTMGAAGAAVTWDNSSLVTFATDSISFLACDSTPYCDSFAGSNLAVTFDNDYFDYLVADTGMLGIMGSSDGSFFDHNNDPYVISVYPMTYGTIRVDTSMQNYDTSLYITTIDSFIADGYGTLKLPSGTYTNVLRVHVISHEKDSAPDPSGPTVSCYTEETYNWYLPGFRFIVLSMYYNVDAAGTATLQDLWYAREILPPPPPPTNIAAFGNHGRLFSVYPNPARDVLHISLYSTSRETATIKITDVSGRTVHEITTSDLLPGTNTISYNTVSLSSGLYVMHVTTPTASYKEKIHVQK